MNKIESLNELKHRGWVDKDINSFPLIMSENKMILKWNTKFSGIYVWINKVNNKMYIGRATDLYRRVYEEKRAFKNGKHENLKKLFNAVNKYGIQNFGVRELMRVSDKTVLIDLEKYFIAYFNTKEEGYNCTYGGDGTTGHIVTEEHRRKQKEKMKEYWTDERKKQHTEKMKLWANDPIRKSHLIDVGTLWTKDSNAIKKHKECCKKSMSKERIEKQRNSIIKHYKLNGGKQPRYKSIILLSPIDEYITISKVSLFCKNNNIGTMGFYRFLRTHKPYDCFRGWKLVSKET